MMIQTKGYLSFVLDTDLAQDTLFCADRVNTVQLDGNDILFSVSLKRKKPLPGLLYFDEDEPDGELFFRLRFYNGEVLRLKIARTPPLMEEESVMLAMDSTLRPVPAVLETEKEGWLASSGTGAFLRLEAGDFAPHLSPDGRVQLQFQARDHFVPNLQDALPAVYLQRGDGTALTGVALQIQPGEHFCGTGERFERPDLFGQQVDLVNFDAAGVNNARAYKNIPFLLSSRGYGLFVHSSAKMRLDIGAHSTRSLQWLVEDEAMDFFLIGGGSPAKVLQNYQCITGFPSLPPTWSFGVWMSRASYYSDAEASEVARRLRAEGYPADVIHLDIGWFEKEWFCDWKFSPTNFPDPADFIRRMRDLGLKVTLWQYPHIRPEIDLAPTALEQGYVGQESNPSNRFWLGYTLDFTNPKATAWYQSLLTPLLEMGAAAIKADFGEQVDETAAYDGMDGSKYHNLFSLLYQKAVWEATEQVYGKGNTVIWARSGWAGSQRYPVHWGGDAASTYDGMAGTLCGGLHFGLSGFAFWSHDVGGIHGIPDFMNTRPSEDLYLRWTQMGVFSSHMRFHGGTPREPWEYPGVAGAVREWLRFRYALLPYILREAEKCCKNGLPLLRSLVIDWPDDPATWSIADEYLFGDVFLVCPVLNPSSERDVYLPAGSWVDFWSGEILEGPRLLPRVRLPLSRLPLFVRLGSQVEFAEPVQHTGQLPQAGRFSIRFDRTYPGFEGSALQQKIALKL